MGYRYHTKAKTEAVMVKFQALAPHEEGIWEQQRGLLCILNHMLCISAYSVLIIIKIKHY